jgi:RNA polymerase sigma factor (sigma-70 family)
MAATTLGVTMSASDGPAMTFDDFYRSHRVDAVRWATALVGRRDIAEELAQDALVRTGDRLARLDNPAAYLRRAVVNACHSWHRSAARESRRLSRATEPTSYTDVVSDGSAEVLRALDRLKAQQRTAVVLRYWADWTDADIAAALGTSEGNVRVMVHRGLAHLRSSLGAGTTDEGSIR